VSTADIYRSLPSYTRSVEMDSDSLAAVDIDGHGHSLDAIEILLETEIADWMDWCDEPIHWDITESWRRTIPTRDEYGFYCGAHHHQGHPGRGARAVTHLELVTPPRYWCLNHRDRLWSTGMPISRLIDGDLILADEVARAASEAEPRETVDAKSEYIYFCSECSSRISDRLHVARQEAAAKQGDL
jgi:hypothetical protein